MLIHCLMLLMMFVDLCVWSLFCNAVLGVLSSFVIILVRKRELVALLLLGSCCHGAVSVLCLFLVVP